MAEIYTPAQGEHFIATVETTYPERVSAPAVREHFKNDPETLKTLITVGEQETLRVTRLGVKPKSTWKAPNLDNATPGGLADQLGDVREQIKELEKTEGFLKEALKARMRPNDK